MKRIFIATCVATLLILVLTTGSPLTDVRAQKSAHKYRPIEQSGEFVEGRVLVKFREGIGADHARQIIAALGTRDAGEIPRIGVHILDLPYQASEMAFAHAFESRPEVEFAELDRMLAVQQMTPNDPLYPSLNSWSLQKINGPDAWSITEGSDNVTIAILDTGVDGTHEDLAAKMVPGWNIYGNNSDTTDPYGHGTMVAGQAAASSNNGVGVTSVAWGCKIMPIRISDDYGYAAFSDIASGLTWASDHGARVANVSYKASDSSTVSRAAGYFQRKGGIVTIAAGNDGSFDSAADDPYILTVGATDSTDTIFSWSSYGNNQDLVAPGTAYTTHRGGGYTVGTGTSASAPMVAGAAALVFSINPNFTPAQVQDILKQSADDQGAPGWDPSYGYGRVNLARAVNMAASIANPTTDSTPPVDTIIAPTQGQNVSNTVSVFVSATDNVGVTKVELYVDGVRYGTSATAPYTIKWATRKVKAGMHTLQSKAYDGAGNVGVSTDLTVYK
jgi:subtilisin family serine protease